MATIQHSALPNSELHEPKHILTSTTADAGKVITPSSVTNGTSQLRSLTLDDLSDSGVTSWTGWAEYHDSAYTSGAPLGIVGGVRTKVLIDGLHSNTDTSALPSGVSDLWNTTTNVITGLSLNDAIIVRVSYTVDAAASSDYNDIELDVGGTSGSIVFKTLVDVKAPAVHRQSIEFTCGVNSDFITNGGTIYLTPSAAADFYDFSIYICRVHKGS